MTTTPSPVRKVEIGRRNESMMLAARMHEYGKPLVLENVPKPTMPQGEGVLVKIGGAGLCHSDLHIIQGEWTSTLPLALPRILGHEAAGWVEETGSSVPSNVLKSGDMVAISGGWGCGICEYCKQGDDHLCVSSMYPGVTADGGYSEFMLVPSYKYLLRVDKSSGLTPVELAPLTDAGLTPYRAVKKVRHLLGPGKAIAVIGIGGLGFYGIQYARLFSQGATVVAVDRNQKKLENVLNKGFADHAVSLSSGRDMREEILKVTANKGLDVVIDCVGAENTISDSFRILRKKGALVVVGLFGSEVRFPLMPSLMSEHQLHLSLWGNYSELAEVVELAKQGKVRHYVQRFPLAEINSAIEMLRSGQIQGRAVIVPS